MFNRDLIVKVGQKSCELNQPVTIYRYDRNIQLTIQLVQYDYEFDQVIETDLLKENHIYKAQTVLKSPKGEIWKDPLIETEIKNDTVKVNFKDVMLDEETEVGKYELQIHLFDKDGSRVTIHPFSITVEDLIGYSGDEEFDSGDEGGIKIEDGVEIEEGDIISSDWLNNIEAKLAECFDSDFYNNKEYDELLTENKEVTFAINELVEEYNYLNDLYLYLLSQNSSSTASVQSVILNDNVMTMSNSKEITTIEVLNIDDENYTHFDVGEYRLFRFRTNLLSIYEKYDVRFKSKDPSTAKCNSTGKVLGVKIGKTDIVAYNKNNPSVKCEFTVYIGPYKPATSIVFDSLKKTVKVGEVFRVSYKINPYNATTTKVTWEVVRGTDILSVSGDTFNALKEGVAYIKATTENGKSCIGEITVVSDPNDPTITGIRVYPKIATMQALTEFYLNCYIIPTGADITKFVTWSSNNNEIATVNENGVVKGLKMGEATITASYLDGKYTDSCVITLTENLNPDPEDYESIHLKLSSDGNKIEVTWEPSELTKPSVDFTTDVEGIINIDEDGNITYLKEGEVNVTGTITGTNVSDTITVITPKYTEINIFGPDEIKASKTGQFDFTWKDERLPKPEVTWSSSDNKIATVDQNGLVTGISPGKVIIKCQYDDDRYGEIIIEITTKYVLRFKINPNGGTFKVLYNDYNTKSVSVEDSMIKNGVYNYYYDENVIGIKFSCNLTEIIEMETSNFTDMSYMFKENGSLTTIPKLNTSNVTRMDSMFYNCSSLIKIPELDTSKVTDMSYMFYGCQLLTTIPLLNTSNVTNMSNMFNACFSLNSIPRLDTSKVTDMNHMFRMCISLNTIPLLTTSNVTNMESMFDMNGTLGGFGENVARYDNYPKLTKIPELDTSKVTNMNYMFFECTSLTYIPPLNTSNVTSMIQMFAYCYSLTTIPDDLDTSKVTDMRNMFSYCTSLTSITLLNTSKVTNMGSMFENCTSLVYVKLLGTSNVTNMAGMFENCTSLTTVTGLDTSNLTYMNRMFYNCKSLTDIPQLYTSNVTNMSEAFRYCESIPTIPQLDTSKVTDMTEMFYNCISMVGTAEPSKYWENTNNPKGILAFTNCINLDNYWDIPTESWRYDYRKYIAIYNISNINSIDIGKTIQLDFTWNKHYYSSKPKVTWSSSDNKIANVDQNGLVTGISDGEVTITCRREEPSIDEIITFDEISIKVYPEIKWISIENKSDISKLYINRKIYLDINWNNSDLIPKPAITWSSSDNSIATVDQNGLITANSIEGEVTITCKYNDTIYDEVTIKIVEPKRIRFRAYSIIRGNGNLIINGKRINQDKLYFENGIFIYEYDYDITSINFSEFTTIVELIELDTSKVTNMNGLFENCSVLNTIPQLDTSNVTDMRYMFNGCSSLDKIPELDTSKVKDMYHMFVTCMALNNIPELNTSSVTNMERMFDGCKLLTSIPKLDTSNVTNMEYMFYDCKSLPTIPQLDTSNVTTMYHMFGNCTSLNIIPELNTSKVNTMYGTFENCTSLTTVTGLDTSSVTDMSWMFYGCKSLPTIPELNTSNVTRMYRMFYGCSSLDEIPELDTSKVNDMHSMFYDCISMVGTAEPSKYWENTNATSHRFCFRNCTKLSNYEDIPSEWK